MLDICSGHWTFILHLETAVVIVIFLQGHMNEMLSLDEIFYIQKIQSTSKSIPSPFVNFHGERNHKIQGISTS